MLQGNDTGTSDQYKHPAQASEFIPMVAIRPIIGTPSLALRACMVGEREVVSGKISRALFAVVLLFATFVANASLSAQTDVVRLVAPTITGTAGSEMDLPFEIDSSEALGAIQVDVSFSTDQLGNVSVEAGALLTSAQGGLEFNLVAPGQIRIAMACFKPVKGKGPLFHLKGELASGAKENALKISQPLAWESQTLRELRVESTDGMLTPVQAGLDFSSMPLWVWIAAGVGSLVILLLIVNIVLLQKRRSAAN